MVSLLTLALYLVLSLPLTAGLLVLIWLADRYEREPFGIVLLAACWGTLPAVFLSCLLEFAVQVPLASMGRGGPALNPFMTIAVAPVVEEGIKAAALFALVAFRRREFDDVLDGMVYGAAVGIGFSFIEDLVYFVSATNANGAGAGLLTFLLRNFGFMLNHSFFTALTGMGLGLARLHHRRVLAVVGFPAAGFLAAVGLHAAHNALASLDMPGLMGALYLHLLAGIGLAVVVFLCWETERRWIAARLNEEVAEGRIPAEALAALPFLRHAGAVPRGRGKELRRALQQLAFARRQVKDDWSPESADELEPLRERVRACMRGVQG